MFTLVRVRDECLRCSTVRNTKKVAELQKTHTRGKVCKRYSWNGTNTSHLGSTPISFISSYDSVLENDSRAIASAKRKKRLRTRKDNTHAMRTAPPNASVDRFLKDSVLNRSPTRVQTAPFTLGTSSSVCGHTS